MRLSLDESCRFGLGVDSVLQQAKGRAIEYDAVSDASGGQTTTGTFQMITSQQQLMETLGVSVSASVRYGMATADARMNFAETNAVNESSVYLMLQASAANPPQHMINPRLSSAAAAIYDADPEAFRRAFGDCYIDEIYTGGTLSVLYMFRTRDESTKTELSGELNASVGNFMAGGDVAVSFKSTVESFQKQSELSITAFVSGGRGVVNPTSIEQAMKLYEQFPATVLNAGVPYYVTAKPWHELPLPAAASPAEAAVRRETIESTGRLVLQAIQARSRIQYILDNPQQFIEPDLDGLRGSRESLHTQVTLWARAARECNEDAAKCSLEGLAFPAISFPKRIQSLDPLGDKIAQVDVHDSRAAAFVGSDAFLPEPLEQKFDRDPRRPEGRWRMGVKSGALVGGVFWTPETGAHVVYGAIYARYMELDHCQGRLGYPTGDEEFFDPAAWPGHEGDRVQRFEHGILWWDAQTSVVSDVEPLLHFNPGVIRLLQRTS